MRREIETRMTTLSLFGFLDFEINGCYMKETVHIPLLGSGSLLPISPCSETTPNRPGTLDPWTIASPLLSVFGFRSHYFTTGTHLRGGRVIRQEKEVPTA